MRYCLCLCVHILSLVHVVSLDICEVKIVAQACIQKISELPTGIEPVSPDCRFGYFTTENIGFQTAMRC